MSPELVEKVSKQSQTLKALIKIPMVLTISTSALQSGVTIVTLKLLTELGQSGSIASHWILSGLMVLGLGASGTI